MTFAAFCILFACYWVFRWCWYVQIRPCEFYLDEYKECTGIMYVFSTAWMMCKLFAIYCCHSPFDKHTGHLQILVLCTVSLLCTIFQTSGKCRAVETSLWKLDLVHLLPMGFAFSKMKN